MTSQRSQHGQRLLGDGGVALLCAQVREVHCALEDCLDEWLRALAPAAPPPGSLQVSLYVHAATIEDLIIHSLLREVPPLFATTWQGRGPANYSTLDLGPVRGYARDVFVAGEAYLAGLDSDSASKTVELSRMGLGQPTVAWVVSRFLVLELCGLTGELRAAIRKAGLITRL